MGHPRLSQERNPTMTTILVLNAGSGLLAAVGIGGFLTWRSRRARREVMVRLLYVTTDATRPLPRR
jgi:hypothetical protein